MKPGIRHSLIILASAMLAACAREGAPAPEFSLERCTRVALFDQLTGKAIVGAEDLDVDRVSGRIFVSAYDRPSAERAAWQGARTIPEGGLYAIDLGALANAPPALDVRPIADRNAVDGGLRPHGIAWNAETGELTFINRRYLREGKQWRLSPQLVTLSPSGEVRSASDINCSSNDLAIHAGEPLISLDHGDCGWRAGVEDIFGWKRARLVDRNGATIAADFGFANGVAAGAGDRLFVAATRENALYPIIFAGGVARQEKAIALGAAPDNLTIADDGHIVAAVYPSLLGIGLQRRLGVGKSPSRIVGVDPESGARRLLFDDPKATVIAAATVAISTQDMLVLGSALDAGIVVCRRPA